jgi:parallel beta-helix repeat protein
LTIKSTSGNPEDTIVQAAVSDQNYQNVFTVTADNVKMDGFTIRGASYFWCSGIWINSDNCIISNNTFEDNAIGIWTHPPSGNDNTIRNNNFASSSGYSPSTALYIESSDNKIYLNNFFIGATGGGSYFTTLWRSPEQITYEYEGSIFTSYLGNYWAGYTDIDAGNDGVWDHSYSINGEDMDYYPLVETSDNYIPAIGKPDLVVDISFSKTDPVEGEPIDITITVKNIGKIDVEDIEVDIACMFTYEITASADDGYSSPQGYYNSTLNLTMVGNFGDEVYFNGWHRFQNVTIPEGADITRAFVTLTAYSDIYTTVPDDTLKTVIHAEYAANPLPPSSASDHAGRIRIPYSVEWDITEWETGEIYNSPDISDIIQCLVNWHNYSSGAAIQIFHDATYDVPSVMYQPEAASGEGSITVCTYDRSPLDAARLYIEYTVTSLRGDLNGDWQITSADVLIALQIAVSGEYRDDADVDWNGYVNALDARMILQAAGGRIEIG